MKDLKDKIVVITGAASGIGLEMARAFATRRREARARGYQCVRPGRGEAGFRGDGPHRIYTIVLDVTKKEQIKDFCDKVYEKTGRVDVLCNNAGVGWAGKFEDWSLESWEQIVAINLWSVIYGCHYFYPRMIAQGGGGHIVNTASGRGASPCSASVGILRHQARGGGIHRDAPGRGGAERHRRHVRVPGHREDEHHGDRQGVLGHCPHLGRPAHKEAGSILHQGGHEARLRGGEDREGREEEHCGPSYRPGRVLQRQYASGEPCTPFVCDPEDH